MLNSQDISHPKKTTNKGYAIVYQPTHPRADSKGYVFEHIVVFENETGTTVPDGCCIHHLNGNKQDNRIENLCMMTHAAHTSFHNFGKKKSEKTRSIISEKAKNRFADKKNHPFYKDVDMKEAIRLHESGMTVKSVCELMGICRKTYYNKLEDMKCSTT